MAIHPIETTIVLRFGVNFDPDKVTGFICKDKPTERHEAAARLLDDVHNKEMLLQILKDWGFDIVAHGYSLKDELY